MTRSEIFTRGLDQRHEQLLAERGGRIAFVFFRLRSHIGLTTADERIREDLISYHERQRQDPKGMLWPEDYMTEQEKDAWRLIGPGH